MHCTSGENLMLVPELESRFGTNSGRRAKRLIGCTTFSTLVVSVAETRGRDSGKPVERRECRRTAAEVSE
jgi:hypothetical protein